VFYGYFGRILLGVLRIFWQDTSRCSTDILAGYFLVFYGYFGRILLDVARIFNTKSSVALRIFWYNIHRVARMF